MHPVLLFVPVISAIIFWLTVKFFMHYFFKPVTPFSIAGFTIQGILPKNKELIAQSLAKKISMELTGSGMLREKLTGAETLQKALPAIEVHIDNFLNVKLKTSLPVISMFIGERVTSQLKELFMKELEELFPSVMLQFIEGIEHNKEIEKEIALKIAAVPVTKMEAAFYTTFRREIKNAEISFALAGLITGFLQLAFLALVL